MLTLIISVRFDGECMFIVQICKQISSKNNATGKEKRIEGKMQSRKGRKQMISGSERDNFKGKGLKEVGDNLMKSLALTRGVVDIGVLDG